MLSTNSTSRVHGTGGSQFVGVEVHHWECPVGDPPATVGKVVAICAIFASRCNWPRARHVCGKHILIANDDWPWGETLELGKEVVAWLRVEVENLGLGCLLLQSLGLAFCCCRLATPLGRVIGSRGRVVLRLRIRLFLRGLLFVCLGFCVPICLLLFRISLGRLRAGICWAREKRVGSAQAHFDVSFIVMFLGDTDYSLCACGQV